MVISLNICLIFNLFIRVLSQNPSEWVDPDIRLCDDLSIDAAIKADDGLDYILKDEYYWVIDSESGLSEDFAQPISKRWPKLPTPLDAAFTLVDENYQWSTAFIKGNEWFIYKSKQMEGNGTTNSWSYFPRVRIDAAFTYFNSPADDDKNKNPIYFLYDSGESFIKYLNIETEKTPNQLIIKYMNYNTSAKTYRYGRWMQFLYNNEITQQTFNTFISDISAVLTNKRHLLILGNDTYCRANMTQELPLCENFPLKNLFKCPRKARPTTTTTTTSTTTTTPSTISSTSLPTNLSITLSINLPTTLANTSSIILSTTMSTKLSNQSSVSEPNEFGNRTSLSTNDWTENPSKESNISQNNNSNKKSGIWFLIVFIIIIIVVIISFIVIFLIKKSKKNNKKTVRKGTPNPNKKTDNSDSNKTVRSENSDSSGNTSKVLSLKSKSELKEDVNPSTNSSSLNSNKMEEADQMIDKLKNSKLQSDPQIN